MNRKAKKRKKLAVKAESLRKLTAPNLENVAGGVTGGCLDTMGCPTIGCDPFKTFTCITFTTR